LWCHVSHSPRDFLILRNVPEGEDALGGSSSKQKKGQKKSKNESDQEETTGAWGFEKPSTSVLVNCFSSSAIVLPVFLFSFLTPSSSVPCPIIWAW
jgi:hypothetical protein